MKLVSVETPEKSVCKMTFSASAEELEVASNAVYERTRATYTIKGFANTLALSVVVSMFTAIIVSRLLMKALINLGFTNAKLYIR